MTFSVIVPVYNVQDYLVRCLDSIYFQTYDDYEVILINDGSTDNSLEILSLYQKKYKKNTILINQENSGQSIARNNGIKKARGEYLFFLDSDDFLDKNALEILFKIINEKSYDLICFNNVVASDLGYEYNDRFSEYKEGQNFGEKDSFLTQNMIYACSKIYRREFFVEEKFEFPEKIKYEDVGLIPFIESKAKSIYISKEYLYFYYLRKGSTTRNGNISQFKDLILATRKLVSFFQEDKNYQEYHFAIMKVIVSIYISKIIEICGMDYKNEILILLVDELDELFPMWQNQNVYSDFEEKCIDYIYARDFKKLYRRVAFKYKMRKKISNFLPVFLKYCFFKYIEKRDIVKEIKHE